MDQPVGTRTSRRRGTGRWEEHNSARQTKILQSAVSLIEENEAGEEISIQQIAERAGLARSVVYRQFDNRDDLDSHVREFILRSYVEQVENALVLDPEKTAEEVIFEVMRTVVRWAAEHPRAYRFGQNGPVHGHAADETSVTIGRHLVAEALWEQFTAWAALLGIDVEANRPLVYGVAGLVEGIVTQFIATEGEAGRPDQETVARMLTASAWHLFAGHAADRGYHFDRSVPTGVVLADLLAQAAERQDGDAARA
ncbi:TetR/AcrR family transcriptional regulator [Nocardia xishanensis]|uniref:TetR/AcrR family transcriptional regulator n=1 Tax=Nocardia xishanensis TaxID=238964 RepID=UPI0034322E16